VKRISLAHTDIVAIALIPALYFAISASFGQNQPGDIDTWFYFGLAKSFWHQWGPDFYNDYYETRLPYIIPAAIIFAIPSDRIASLIISYLIYCSCAFSLFYVLSRQVSKPVALLATILMASDIFFMRTVGWQYVDGGVLAYGSLTFAALTAASANRHKYAFVALSGFFYASMLMVHLGSAPLGLAIFGYAIFILDMRRMAWKEFFILILCAGLGALSCQIIYGSLNMYLYGTDFWFEREQIVAGIISEKEAAAWEPLDSLLATGWWLTVHIGVWLAAGAMIIAKFAKLCTPTRFQSYCMLAVFPIYSILFALDYFHVSLFLGRSGLYLSPYLFLSYLFIGSMLRNTTRTSIALIVGGIFLVSLSVRFKFNAELARELPPMWSWAVGLALGALLTAVGLVKNKWGLAAVALVVVVVSLPITWPFSYVGEVYAARKAIADAVGDRLPYFAFSEKDPVYGRVIVGLVGSFTPRAWWIKCRFFPDCTVRTFWHDMMIVVSSDSETAEVSSIASSGMPEVTLSDAKLIYQSKDNFSVYRFIIPKSFPMLIPASKLFSGVGSADGDARVAREGTIAGYLTYGPHASVDPGRYEVTIKYESEGEAGSWDIVTGANVILAKGSIPDTRGAKADIVATIDLPNGAEGLEARTLYSGHGRLSVLSLGIQLLSRPPALKVN
jgi:hypothetical protein